MHRSVILLVLLCSTIAANAQTTFPPTNPNLNEAPLYPDAMMTDDEFQNPVMFSFDDVVNDWLSDSRVLRPAPCAVGGKDATCLFVVKFDGNGCDITHVDFTSCDMPADQRDSNHFCMVSDEFSQVGLALAMHGDKLIFDEWVNTLNVILYGNPRYPLWNVRVSTAGPRATIEADGHDDASDATARIMTALFIAASSTSFLNDQRIRYRILADELSEGFQKDFIDTGEGTSPRYWLASGRNAAGPGTTLICTRPPDLCDPFGYAGYYGDVAIALLAASRSALHNRSIYSTIAADTVLNYLKAAQFTSSFKVPPTSFAWRSTDAIECVTECLPRNDCNQKSAWDSADAVRGISLCKAKYYANLAGTSLGTTLDNYCTAWLNSGGFGGADTNFAYSRQYAWDGTFCNKSVEYENLSLGASMNFFFDRPSFGGRLGNAFHFKYSRLLKRFESSPCMDAYFPAFAINNFGSGIGRDRAAFMQPSGPIALVATASFSNGHWSASTDWSDAGTTYTLQRATTNLQFTNIATSLSATHYVDDNLTPNSVYLYRVIASNGTQSNADPVSTFSFTATIQPGTIITAAPINEVRTAINKLRLAVGRGNSGSDVAQFQTIHASDINALRTGLNEALADLSLQPVTFCQPSLTSQLIRACDILELRSGTQ